MFCLKIGSEPHFPQPVVVSHAVWDQENIPKMVTPVISHEIQKANSNDLYRRNWIGSQNWKVSVYLDPDTQMMLVWFPQPLGSTFPDSSFVLRRACALCRSPAAVSFPLTSFKGKKRVLLSNTFAKVPWKIVIALAWVVCGPLPQLLLGVGAPIRQLPVSWQVSVS